MTEASTLSVPEVCTIFEAQPRDHKDGGHLLVLEGDKIAYVAVPPLEFPSETNHQRLCFTDHQKSAQDEGSKNCCLWETEHVHAHVHHGEITEDVLLEQCMEEACCALSVPWDITGLSSTDSSYQIEHEHNEACGHSKIAHGDHTDWLVPMKDGSFLLSHPEMSTEGASHFIEHGRLVKVGKSLAKLQKHSKLVDLFSYVSPKGKGYESLPGGEVSEISFIEDPSDGYCGFLSSPVKPSMKDEMVKIAIPEKYRSQGLEKTVLDVMGICCPAEIPLVKKILEPLPGVEEVSVNVTSKKVTVLHDQSLTPDVQLVKALNAARMEASIHLRGEVKIANKWPSPWTIACGCVLVVSFFQYLYHPLRWVALGSIAVGIPRIILRSLASIRRLILDINLLMLIAVAGAIALGDYLEAGSIVFLFTIADWLESRSSNKARAALSSLMNLVPQSAILAENGQRVPVEDVKLKTLIAIKAGEMIPIDGVVISGKCSVDESSLTGESRPVEKDIGAQVWAGTVNLSGFITAETTALSEDSAVSRMVKLVEEAHTKRSHTEQMVERFAKYYTPVLVAAAVAVAVVPLAAHVHNERHWLYLALVLLVVACPCALVISTPVTTTCGITQAARIGLIIKGGSFLEVLGKIKTVAIDKTGTLTEGHFAVSEMLPVDRTTDLRQMLYWIASVESKSSHPMAPALIAYSRLHAVEVSQEITDFEILTGEGVSALVDGHFIQIGNERLAIRLGWHEDVDAGIREKCSIEGSSVGWVGVDGKCIGLYSMADQPRPEASEAMEKLKKLGVKAVMLTGDNYSSALAVSRKVGNMDFHAQLLPEDKVKILQELKSAGTTGMIGDGINDAPALAAADVGIAMGVAGSAVAMETADIALMTNDLRKLAAAVLLGRKCLFKIQQNVCLSIVTKVIIIVLAAVGYASLWAAVLADVGTCIVVIFNSMLVLKKVDVGCCSKKNNSTISTVTGCFSCGHCGGSAESGADIVDDCCGSKCTDDCEAPKRCCEGGSGHVRKSIRRRQVVKECCSSNCDNVLSQLSASSVDASCTTKCCSQDLGVAKPENVRSSYCHVEDRSGNCCSKIAAGCGDTNAGSFLDKSLQNDFDTALSSKNNKACCTKAPGCCDEVNKFNSQSKTSSQPASVVDLANNLPESSKPPLSQKTISQEALAIEEDANLSQMTSTGCAECCKPSSTETSHKPFGDDKQLMCCTTVATDCGQICNISSPNTLSRTKETGRPVSQIGNVNSKIGPASYCSISQINHRNSNIGAYDPYKLNPPAGCKNSCCKLNPDA